MQRQIDVELKTPKITTAGGGRLAPRTKTTIKTATAAAVAIATLFGSTACSSNENQKKANSEKPPSPSAPMKEIPTEQLNESPAITTPEALKVAQNYLDATDKSLVDHTTIDFSKVESGDLLEVDLARNARIKEHGDLLGFSKATVKTTNMETWSTTRQPGDQWFIATANTTIDEHAMNVLHLFQQKNGETDWKATFSTYARQGASFPELQKDSEGLIKPITNKDSLTLPPDKACAAFIDFQNQGNSTPGGMWGKSAVDIAESRQKYVESARKSSNNGQVSVKLSARSAPLGPAWATTDGGALILCSAENKSTMKAAPGTFIRYSGSKVYENLAGRSTKWSQASEKSISMFALHVPRKGTGKIEVPGVASLPLSFEGTP